VTLKLGPATPATTEPTLSWRKSHTKERKLMQMQLADIMMRKIESASKEQLAAMPRDTDGSIVLDSDVFEDGTELSIRWNEVEGRWIGLSNPDEEYLMARVKNILPDVPIIVRQTN
jgi:hypothetical protein